jgi:uncharacterized iron-regulated protein
MSARALAATALLAVASGCATSGNDPRLVLQPIAKDRPWVSTLHRDHPLVGKIWEGRAGRFVDEAALADALTGADLALLGETHDNPDHHVLQARLIRTIVTSGKRPALALEMLTSDLQPDVDAAETRTPREPDQLKETWKKGGWPDFDLYRPVLSAGLEAGLRIVAANLPRPEVRSLVTKGLDAADPALRARLDGGPKLPPEAIAELRKEMMDSHCGELPEAMMDGLLLAQRARDATLAARLAGAARDRGGILVAGKGHVRDRDVPAWLAHDAAGRKVVAVAFVEVDPELKEPAQYVEEFGKGPFPFDYAVFTPGTKREDPCEKLRQRMEKMGKSKPQATDSAAPAAPAPAAPAGAAPPAP